jgi:hypothetical protein
VRAVQLAALVPTTEHLAQIPYLQQLHLLVAVSALKIMELVAQAVLVVVVRILELVAQELQIKVMQVETEIQAQDNLQVVAVERAEMARRVLAGLEVMAEMVLP